MTTPIVAVPVAAVTPMELLKRIAVIDLPSKGGKGIVTLENIQKGELIVKWFPHDKRIVDRVYPSLQAFQSSFERLSEADIHHVLHHSWPSPSGQVAVGATNGYFGMINHANDDLTVLHEFTARQWNTTAAKDLEPGQELCFNYNLGSKYEVRTDEHMKIFHSICSKYHITKQPSKSMTLPPVKIEIDDESRQQYSVVPIQSFLPHSDNGAPEDMIWV